MTDATTAFWQHQLTRGRRPTPRAREEMIKKRPLKMSEDERIQVATDPDAVVRALQPKPQEQG